MRMRGGMKMATRATTRWTKKMATGTTTYRGTTMGQGGEDISDEE